MRLATQIGNLRELKCWGWVLAAARGARVRGVGFVRALGVVSAMAVLNS